MKKFIASVQNLPWLLKVILCIPALDIIWCIVRLCRSLVKGNPIGIILAILTIIPGAAVIWIVDLICVIFSGKIWWFD